MIFVNVAAFLSFYFFIIYIYISQPSTKKGTVNSLAQISSDILAEVQLYKFNGQCTLPLSINQLLLEIPLLIKLAVFKIFLLRNTVLRQAYLLDVSCLSNAFCPSHCWLYNVILHIQASMLIHHGNQMPIEKAIGRMNICKLMHWFIRYAFSVMKFNIITVAVIDSF